MVNLCGIPTRRLFGHKDTLAGTMKEGHSAWRPRAMLIFLVTLFLGPVVAAWWLHSGIQWRPADTVNHGVLVIPARRLNTTYPLLTPAGAALRSDYLKGKWTLVTVGDSSCDRVCAKNFYTMRQVTLAQGKNVLRVQRLFIAVFGHYVRPDSVSEYPDMDVVVLSPSGQGAFLASFNIDASDPIKAGRVYLIDPLGNLMMLYDFDADPTGIIEDLRRLLKVSAIG